MTRDILSIPSPPILRLLHLSGEHRGTLEIHTGDSLRLGSDPENEICLANELGHPVAPLHAVLRRQRQTYRLEAPPCLRVAVNGVRTSERELATGDVVRLGDAGPKLRIQLIQASESKTAAFRVRPPVLSYGFLANRPAGSRLWAALLAILLAVAVFALLQQHERLDLASLRLTELEQRLESPERPVVLAKNIDADTLTHALERLDSVEARLDASRRVVAHAAQAIVLIQGSYGFVDRVDGRPLRYMAVDADDEPLRDPFGMPLTTLEGEGPKVETPFVGSAFVVSHDGLLVTNRHVARPWEPDPVDQALIEEGFEPVLLRFLGYYTGSDKAVQITLVAASDSADIALLRSPQLAGKVSPLRLGTAPPRAGEEVLLLGYPTGIRALLARADESLIGQLLANDADTWTIAQRLAEHGAVAPLATRGIVGQVSPTSIVYDAETTSGGSGGPVINLAGEVVAVNTSILPEFGGSNLGVPIAPARQLLDGMTERQAATTAKLDWEALLALTRMASGGRP